MARVVPHRARMVYCGSSDGVEAPGSRTIRVWAEIFRFSIRSIHAFLLISASLLGGTKDTVF
jgi:hypothetical protein